MTWLIYAENGAVLSSSFGKNQQSQDTRLLYQTQLTQDKDVQTVERRQFAGFISRAPAGTKLFVTKFSDHYKISLAEDDGIIDNGLSEGDSKVYGSASGSITSEVYCKSDGTIEINGNADYAVSWTDLNTALQSLVSAINTALGTKGDASGTAGTLSLDLSAAKETTIKLP